MRTPWRTSSARPHGAPWSVLGACRPHLISVAETPTRVAPCVEASVCCVVPPPPPLPVDPDLLPLTVVIVAPVASVGGVVSPTASVVFELLVLSFDDDAFLPPPEQPDITSARTSTSATCFVSFTIADPQC